MSEGFGRQLHAGTTELLAVVPMQRWVSGIRGNQYTRTAPLRQSNRRSDEHDPSKQTQKPAVHRHPLRDVEIIQLTYCRSVDCRMRGSFCQ